LGGDRTGRRGDVGVRDENEERERDGRCELGMKWTRGGRRKLTISTPEFPTPIILSSSAKRLSSSATFRSSDPPPEGRVTAAAPFSPPPPSSSFVVATSPFINLASLSIFNFPSHPPLPSLLVASPPTAINRAFKSLNSLMMSPPPPPSAFFLPFPSSSGASSSSSSIPAAARSFSNSSISYLNLLILARGCSGTASSGGEGYWCSEGMEQEGR